MVYAEHLLSFRKCGILVCAWQRMFTWSTANKNLDTESLISFVGRKHLTCVVTTHYWKNQMYSVWLHWEKRLVSFTWFVLVLTLCLLCFCFWCYFCFCFITSYVVNHSWEYYYVTNLVSSPSESQNLGVALETPDTWYTPLKIKKTTLSLWAWWKSGHNGSSLPILL